MIEPRIKMVEYLLGHMPYIIPNLLNQQQQTIFVPQLQQPKVSIPCFIPPLLQPVEPKSASSLKDKENVGFRLYAKGKDQEDSETVTSRDPPSEDDSNSVIIPKLRNLAPSSKKITKLAKKKDSRKAPKKIYEISRFFVKNYVGALRSCVNNPSCEEEIMEYLGCTKEALINIRQELEKLLRENPKHNRMQLYKLMINPALNPAFQYFLRKKVFAWIFTSSKMQDRYAHLMARKNFLYLCLNANSLTPNNFRIALNAK